jgi:CRP/FNR family cyclic AMP-dependent transcriptional regulator
MVTNIRSGQAEPAPSAVAHLFQPAKRTCLFAAGETIFQQGATGDAVYMIMAGEVAIVHDGTCIAICRAGELLGEMAMLDGQSRSATAVAHTACVLAAIDPRTFQLLIDTTPSFATQVMRTLATRLRGRLSTPGAAPVLWRTLTARLRGQLRSGTPGNAASPIDGAMTVPCPID